MRAYKDRYGLADELDRLQSTEQKLGRLDKDLAELAYWIREKQAERDSEPNSKIWHSFYDARNGFDSAKRLMFVSHLSAEYDTRTNLDIDYESLKFAIRFYMDRYEQYGVTLQLVRADVTSWLSSDDSKVFPETPILKTVVGVPRAIARSDYAWGYTEGIAIHYTGKLIDLAYTLKQNVFNAGTSNKQIREEVDSCSAIQFNGSIDELYTSLTRIRGRKKDHKDGPALATLLKTVLRK